jgi:DNA polymerase I-like protein with 3'-5' exonuclease and polymerase domains
MRLLYDLETNGFYDAVSVIHCTVTCDLDTGAYVAFVPDEWVERLAAEDFGVEAIRPQSQANAHLNSATYLAGHNILDYDNRVIEKLHPGEVDFETKTIRDTLVMSKLIYSNIKTGDFERIKEIGPDGLPVFPKYLIGRHSLESWGYRLKAHKDDYSKRMKEQGLDPWASFNTEMLAYCILDVKLNVRLWKAMRKKRPDPRSVELEMAVAAIIQEQERNGFPFDEKRAATLYASLVQRRDELERQCETLFPPWWIGSGKTAVATGRKMKRPDLGHTTVEVRHKTSGKLLRVEERPVTEDYEAGTEHTKAKLISFNPSSRAHIEDRLRKLYGWQPVEFTPDGGAKLDDDVLSALPYPPCKLLSEYFMVVKRIAALAEGKQSWLGKVKQGHIYGRCDPNAAGTGRATHSSPNLAQVPSCFNADGPVPYGKECRELFTTVSHIGLAPADHWVLVGSDAAGLELACLAHFLYPFDKGEYAKAILSGDVHWLNVQALGLVEPGTPRDKHNDQHEYFRALAKRFIYAFLYGAGPELIGALFGVTPAQINKLGNNARIAKKLIKQGRPPNPELVATIRKGEVLIDRFLERTPAITKLKQQLLAEWKKDGFITGLDGRPIHIRSAHSILNFLLQSAGALICKRWLVEKHAEYRARGWKNGIDYMQSVWVHDETQTQARKEIADELGKIDVECVGRAGKYFNFRLPLGGDYKIGASWAETH